MGVVPDRGLLGIAPLHPTYGISEEKEKKRKGEKKRGRIEYLAKPGMVDL
ncbi:MAG: hypothetical protein M0Q95_03435 [Porticoccaceae bacterium]|nr:hypothetical protein [Porticoccaceae bacterium]